MAETKSAPPYEQSAPYTTSAPPQPMMHQDNNYPQASPSQVYPQSPPPQAYPQSPPSQHGSPGVAQIAPVPLQSPHPQYEADQKGSYYPQQQQIPMQQQPQQFIQQPMQGAMVLGPMGQPSQYHTATPLQNLAEGAAPVDCPSCRTRALTRTDYVAGNTAIGWAALLCFCLCLGCIPFMMRSLKDVEHHCGKCGSLLATWHNSGRTVVHVHG